MNLIGACRPSSDSATDKKLAELKLTPEEAKRILTEISTKRAEHEPPRAAPTPPTTANSSATAPAETAPVAVEVNGGPFIVDELEDIGPAAPSVATPFGVFLVNGGNELFLAKVNPLAKTPTPGPSSIGVVPDVKGPFALGRGPTLTAEYAYWVTSHFLLRRPVAAPYGPLEVIAEDARVGTRAAAVTLKSGQAAVAYIALPKVKNGPLRARLWFERDAPKTAIDLTDTGNSTLSVALIARREDALALTLEARMGVTALHSRSIDVNRGIDAAGSVLGPDEVVWIGGTAQPLTEVRAAGKPDAALALLAMEQDSSHFGLAVLSRAPSAKEVRETWLTFPNGLDPAPVSAASTCGKDLVLFARPSESAPKAPQELVLAELVAGALGNQTVLSRARAYYDVSIAPLPHGALVSFVADQRTWALTLRCGRP